MYVGIFGDVIFSVGHLRTLTLSNFKGSTGAEWVEHLTNAVSNGRPSGGTWYDSTVELPNENMMYGSHIFAPASDGTNIPNNYTISKSQLPLFRLAPWLNFTRSYWCWLRDVVSAACFADAGNGGYCTSDTASSEAGVRPVAGLIG